MRLRRILQKVHQKGTSETGASLSLALLFFVLCAVCASVILTAATAAAGRLRSTADSDQRYQAVVSAAKYLNTQFQAVKLEIVETKTTVTETTVTTTITEGTGENGEKTEEKSVDESTSVSYRYTPPAVQLSTGTEESLQEKFLAEKLLLPAYLKQLQVVYPALTGSGVLTGSESEESDSEGSSDKDRELSIAEEITDKLWKTELGMQAGESDLLSLTVEAKDGSQAAAVDLSALAQLKMEKDGSLLVTEISSVEKSGDSNTLVEGNSSYRLHIRIPAKKTVARKIISEVTEDDSSGVKEDGSGTRIITTTTVEEKRTTIGYGTGTILKGKA